MRYIVFKKQGRIKKILILIVALAAIIFVFNFFQHNVRNFFYSISLPAQNMLWNIGNNFSNFSQSIIHSGDLKKEADNLRLENQSLLSQLVLLKEAKNENETLRTALGVGLEKEFKLFPAKIIGKDVSQDVVLVGRGSKDGVSKNMPLINQQRVLFGKVAEVYDNFSKVTLISSKDISFDGNIQEKEIPGLVRGEGGLKVLLDLVPNDKEMVEGDVVATSGLGGIFPKNLLIGKVGKVIESDLEPIKKAEIIPFFDIGTPNLLFLIAEF